MNELQEIMKMMLNHVARSNQWFFNLLEVLADKGILNNNDLLYIKEHEEERVNYENQT